jgi:uncharacterized membrane protein
MKKNISGQIGQVRKHQLFRDNVLMLAVLINVALLLGLLFWSITHIRPTELSVPIRFTSFANFDILGKWYQLYELFVIGLLVFMINLGLALVAHSKSRLASAALIGVSIVVSLVCFGMLVGFTAINFGGV